MLPTIRKFVFIILFGHLSLVSADNAAWIDLAVPDDSIAIAKADIQAVLGTPLGKSARSRMRDNYNSLNTRLNGDFGFKLKNLSYAWFAFSAKEGGLVLLQGDFKKDKVIKKMQRNKDWQTAPHPTALQVSRYKSEYGSPQIAALLKEDLMAMGNPEVVANVLAKWQSGPTSEIRRGVTQVDQSTSHISAAALDLKPFQTANPMYALINHAWLEGMITDDAVVTLSAESLNPIITQGLEQIIEGLLQVIPTRPNVLTQPLAIAAVQNATMARDEAVLNISTMITGDVIMARLPQRRPF
jgi:hypothetical protein